jgi:23S rRNA pseudouridine1911/1915/1917 synthase
MTEDLPRLSFAVEATSSGMRLDQFLADRLMSASRMRISNIVAQGGCLVNKLAARSGQRLNSGDLVEIAIDERSPSSMSPEPIKLDIVFEDDDLIVINKPSGMLVHPTRGIKSGTLANGLTYHFNESKALGDAFENDGGFSSAIRPGIVHRLDRATSGLMVVAKNQRALSILSRHFHKKLIEKRYLAVLDGTFDELELVITASIGRDEAGPPFWRVMEGGKSAETRLRVVQSRSGTTLVELEPITGRTNQLRIHCAYICHPILGDEWYGGSTFPRLCLHAARLGFHHPTGGDWMEFESALPGEVWKA